MVARRDAPEMFEAFRMAEAERRRRAQEATGEVSQAPEGVTEEIPVTDRSDQTEQNLGRPPAAARPVRPWTQASKGQEPAFYLPLGQRCQFVLSMSYRVAVGIGIILVLVLTLAFVCGVLIGGCESVGEPSTDQLPSGGAAVEPEPSPGPSSEPPVAPSPTPGPPPTPPQPPTPEVVYRVQVVTVNNTAHGKAELAEMKTALESRGYRDIELKPNANNSKLFMMVGRFGKDHRTEASALAVRVKGESFKGRFPFREAFVVQTSGR